MSDGGIDRALNTATKILKNTIPSMGFSAGAGAGAKQSWMGSTGAGAGAAANQSWMGSTGTGTGVFGSGSFSGFATNTGSGPTGKAASLLKAVYYAVFFLFIVFITLCIINYTITPIFYFTPGDPGYIYIPGGKDESELFWTTKPPNQLDFHPRKGNPSDPQKFDVNLTISVDVYIPNIVGVPIEKRLLFFKADKQFVNMTDTTGTWEGHGIDPLNPTSSRDAFRKTILNINTSQRSRISFIAYVDEEDRLCIDFFNARTPNSPWITMGPFENTPISEPFRITLTIQPTIFEAYLNGKLAQTRYIQAGYTSPTLGNEAVFPSPQLWRIATPGVAASCSSASGSTSSIQLLNLHYWATRVLSSSEIGWMSPSLATKSYFDSIGADAVGDIPNPNDTSIKTTDYPAGAEKCPAAPSYNPYKDIDWKSGVLLLAALATAAFIFRPGAGAA